MKKWEASLLTRKIKSTGFELPLHDYINQLGLSQETITGHMAEMCYQNDEMNMY